MNRTKTILLTCILSCLLIFLPKALWADSADVGASAPAVVETSPVAAEPAATEAAASEAPVAVTPSEASVSEKTVSETTVPETTASEAPVKEEAVVPSDDTETKTIEAPSEDKKEGASASDSSEPTSSEDRPVEEETPDTADLPETQLPNEMATEDAAEVEKTPEVEKDDASSVDKTENRETEPEADQLPVGSLSTKQLKDAPMLFGAATLENAVQDGTVYVTTFQQLKDAISNAPEDGDTVLKIVVKNSFSLTETLTIAAGKNIILTAENAVPKDNTDWTVENPADYADKGEARQRQVINESRRKGEEALTYTDL